MCTRKHDAVQVHAQVHEKEGCMTSMARKKSANVAGAVAFEDLLTRAHTRLDGQVAP